MVEEEDNLRFCALLCALSFLLFWTLKQTKIEMREGDHELGFKRMKRENKKREGREKRRREG